MRVGWRSQFMKKCLNNYMIYPGLCRKEGWSVLFSPKILLGRIFNEMSRSIQKTYVHKPPTIIVVEVGINLQIMFSFQRNCMECQELHMNLIFAIPSPMEQVKRVEWPIHDGRLMACPQLHKSYCFLISQLHRGLCPIH